MKLPPSFLQFGIPIGMLLAAAMSRLLPHPPNFTPVIALALFGGAYFKPNGLAFAVPLAAMIISDIALTFTIDTTFFSPMRPVIYSCIAATTWMGFAVRRKISTGRLAAVSLAGSSLLFLASNLAVWIFQKGMYPDTPGGLLMCYVAALPFFKNTLLSTAFYTGLLFGVYEYVRRRSFARQQDSSAVQVNTQQ